MRVRDSTQATPIAGTMHSAEAITATFRLSTSASISSAVRASMFIAPGSRA